VISYLRDIERQRIMLVERSSAQRAALADTASPLARRLGALDRVVTAVRSRPVMIGLVAGALAVFGPRRLLAWAGRAAAAYSLLRRI
jgi:hypothetical protein